MKVSKAMLAKVLIFAAFAGVMTVMLGVKLANSRLFADTYVLQAEFDNANGVIKGDAVKLAGVDIGRVEGAAIEDGKAVVTFNLDKTVELPTDSSVAIRWRNVLGQRFLYVYPGNDDAFFSEGDRVPGEQNRDVNDIGEFFNRIGPVLKAIDPDEANAFLDAVNIALTGNERDVRQLIDDGATLASTLAGEDEEIKDLLTSADTILAAYAGQEEAIGDIFDDLDSVGGVLARRIGDINSLVTDFAVVQRHLDGLATRNRTNIDTSLDSLDVIARVLKNNRTNLAETLKTLPLGTAGYYQTSSWGEFFNVRIVEIQVRDQQSGILVKEREAENQHGDEGGSPEVGHGANDGYEKNENGEDGDPKQGGGNSRGDDDPQRSGRTGIESVLGFVLMGRL
jgi:phospholipid/cholesterol/gamma-HCH transport system substrate-binding protein